MFWSKRKQTKFFEKSRERVHDCKFLDLGAQSGNGCKFDQKVFTHGTLIRTGANYFSVPAWKLKWILRQIWFKVYDWIWREDFWVIEEM